MKGNLLLLVVGTVMSLTSVQNSIAEVDHMSEETSANRKALSSRCYIRGETGRCRAYFPSYYFNHRSSSCVRYIFGGCGQKPPFRSREECRNVCR